VHIAEWIFGDQGWAFDLGARVSLRCERIDADERASLLQFWDEDVLREIAYSVDGVTWGNAQISGVITAITALAVRYPEPWGGHAIPRSGTARQVSQAKGWTGDVDATQGLINAFILDIDSSLGFSSLCDGA
jgi:hypothetical protein